MRLIDADKIKWDIGTVWPDVGTRVVPYSDIERAETVEAISIEWIEKWIETDRNSKRRTPYYYKRLFRSRLKMMLEDWEKEDGTETN